ncbi:hypothetical protein SASPL_143813 [Salvia splendens]|uniref:F-box domain-containing protein n=1 Tax=Salvia splendens TaxID=180675 RepID=A0A8X8WMA4_SALSN|nr:hypothetical protein SASPL_143813 [Salvia splendens]
MLHEILIAISPILTKLGLESPNNAELAASSKMDYSLSLPDECLACIFHYLSSVERKRGSAVCRCWLAVEGQSGNCLSLKAEAELAATSPTSSPTGGCRFSPRIAGIFRNSRAVLPALWRKG